MAGSPDPEETGTGDRKTGIADPKDNRIPSVEETRCRIERDLARERVLQWFIIEKARHGNRK
jgi:hypothetical protein